MRNLGRCAAMSRLVGQDEIPAVEAVTASVRHDVARLPHAVLGRVAEQVGAASAVDAHDRRFRFHGRSQD